MSPIASIQSTTCGSVGTGATEAEMINVALAGAALLPLLVVSAPAAIVLT